MSKLSPHNSSILKAFCVISLFFLISSGCKKEPDPCINTTPADASFTTYSTLCVNWGECELFETDTFTMSPYENYDRQIWFKVNDVSVDSCWWKVGYDQRIFTEKEFFLKFSDVAEIDVTLIVKKFVDKKCFPNVNEYDTLTKKIFLLPYGSSPIEGFYNGAFQENSNDTFTIEIQRFHTQLKDSARQIINFPPGFPNASSGNIFVYANHRYFSFEDVLSPPMFKGFGKVNPDGTINISLDKRYWDEQTSSVKYTQHKFNGKKIK